MSSAYLRIGYFSLVCSTIIARVFESRTFERSVSDKQNARPHHRQDSSLPTSRIGHKYPIARVTHDCYSCLQPPDPAPATHHLEHMFDSWARCGYIQCHGRQQRHLSRQPAWAHRAAAHHPERHPRFGDQPRLPAEHPRNRRRRRPDLDILGGAPVAHPGAQGLPAA